MCVARQLWFPCCLPLLPSMGKQAYRGMPLDSISPGGVGFRYRDATSPCAYFRTEFRVVVSSIRYMSARWRSRQTIIPLKKITKTQHGDAKTAVLVTLQQQQQQQQLLQLVQLVQPGAVTFRANKRQRHAGLCARAIRA